MRRLRRPLLLVWGACIAGFVAFSLVAFGVNMVQDARVGIRFNHIVWEQDGAYYTGPRGGDLDERPKYPLSREKFLEYQEYDARAQWWARRAGAFFFAVVVLSVILFKDHDERPTEDGPARDPDRGATV